MRPEAIRARLGWTQRQCARYLRVDVSTWLGWETGKNGPSPDNLARLRAMAALVESEEGLAELREWVADDTRRREERRAGRNLHPSNKIGR